MSATCLVDAQEEKFVVLNLKTGYSVKGEIIEHTAQGIKIKTLNGEIYEYKSDEIGNMTNTKLTSLVKKVPLVVSRGDKLFSAGISFFKQLPVDKAEKSTVPPISISFEYIINSSLFDGKGALGIGAFAGYYSSKKEYDADNKNSRLIIGPRGYFHYALAEKFDTYGGILLGYKNDVNKYRDYLNKEVTSTSGKETLNLFAGCRYFFNDKIAGMAELGWGISIITVGVTVKL